MEFKLNILHTFFRVNNTWACTECQDSLTTYDWMYLVFMVLVGNGIFLLQTFDCSLNNNLFVHFIPQNPGLLAQWYSIDIFSPAQFSFKTVLIHISALIETLLSAIIALLLVSQPIGSLSIKSCAAEQVFYIYNYREIILI